MEIRIQIKFYEKRAKKVGSDRKEPGSGKVSLCGSCWHSCLIVLWSWRGKKDVSRFWRELLKPRFGFYFVSSGELQKVFNEEDMRLILKNILECICGMNVSGERHTQSIGS